MMFVNRLKPMFIALGLILVLLVATSILDIILVFLNPRFYSNALFITTFGVGGVFAAVFAYMMAIERSADKDEIARWSLVLLIILVGILFFFVFSKLEGGEYGSAFKAYGITMALTTLLFMKGKID